MGVSSSSLTPDMSPETLEGYKAELQTKCEDILAENPDNRCCKYVIKYLATDEGKSLSPKGENWIVYASRNNPKETIEKKQLC